MCYIKAKNNFAGDLVHSITLLQFQTRGHLNLHSHWAMQWNNPGPNQKKLLMELWKMWKEKKSKCFFISSELGGMIHQLNTLYLSVSFICSQMLYFAGRTGHAEVVRVVFQPEQISFASLLKVFWESHNPTQGTSFTNKLITLAPKENTEFLKKKTW